MTAAVRRGRRPRGWRIAAYAAIAAVTLLLAACAESGGHLEGDLHDQLHEIAHEACERIEGGADADSVVAETIAEAARLGASEARTRDILAEECADLIE